MQTRTYVVGLALAIQLLGHTACGPMDEQEAQALADEVGTTASELTTEEPGVYVYEHRDFGGDWRRITSSVYDFRTIGFNDRVTAIRIVGDYRATFYSDWYYTGRRSTLGPNASCRDAGLSFQTTSSGFLPSVPWCTWEFRSPDEVGNDSISSVFITAGNSYERSTRLVDASVWGNGVAGVGAATWKFRTDGTYQFMVGDSTSIKVVDGRFTMRAHFGDLIYNQPFITANMLTLTAGVYREYRNGILARVGREPDRNWFFRHEGWNAIRFWQYTGTINGFTQGFWEPNTYQFFQ